MKHLISLLLAAVVALSFLPAVAQTQMERGVEQSLRELDIQGADLSALDTSDLETIKSIAEGGGGIEEKRSRVEALLKSTGAL